MQTYRRPGAGTWPGRGEVWPAEPGVLPGMAGHDIVGSVLYLIVKAALSGLIIAIVSEVARRSPGFGALIASLPLVSVMGMMWLWHDTHDPERLAAHSGATLWFVLPSLPMFALIPVLLRLGANFWLALALGCALTVTLYSLMVWIGPRFGINL